MDYETGFYQAMGGNQFLLYEIWGAKHCWGKIINNIKIS